MLLQRLNEYANTRMKLPPQLYSEKQIRYIIELDDTGHALGVTDTADAASPKTKRGVHFLMPDVTRSVAIVPLLLADKADYTLGIGGPDAKPKRVAECHAAYHDLIDRCAVRTDAAELRTIQQFYRDDGPAKLTLPNEFDPTALLTFRIAGAFPTELTSVQAFWAAEHNPASGDETMMQCIVCGQRRPVLQRLQGKIKGVPGGQMAGTSIISANSAAFESYGLEASLIAPTCASCGEHFTKALNFLLSSEQNHLKVNETVCVFWTRTQQTSFNFGTLLSKPDAAQVKALADGIRSGKRGAALDDDAFYAVTLSASGGRTVIRDWIDTTVGEAKAALQRWFALQALMDERGELAAPLGLYLLAGSTVRELKDLPVTTPRALLNAALTQTPLPMAMLYQAVRRNRAEQGVTRPRAALIKLVLLSHQPHEMETTMVELDPTHPDPAYHCGRLLAVLADIQEAAIGKAAIVDRFYGTASSAPASVFGRLLRGAQPHLAKLERDRRTTASALNRRLEGVVSALSSFPTTLTLQQQGLFALGFYHQRAHDRAQMVAAAARKRAAAADTAAPSSAADDQDDLFADTQS